MFIIVEKYQCMSCFKVYKHFARQYNSVGLLLIHNCPFCQGIYTMPIKKEDIK